METNNFLNKKQVTELDQRMWVTNANGRYITLYKDDFSNSNVWEEVCQQLDIDTNTEKVDILYFGTQTN
jgi:hypothetical protein